MRPKNKQLEYRVNRAYLQNTRLASILHTCTVMFKYVAYSPMAKAHKSRRMGWNKQNLRRSTV